MNQLPLRDKAVAVPPCSVQVSVILVLEKLSHLDTTIIIVAEMVVAGRRTHGTYRERRSRISQI